MFRINLSVLLILSIISFSYAQDSSQKATPVKAATAKTYPKYKTHKYHGYRYHAQADSIAKAGARQAPVNTDTTAQVPVIIDKSLNGQYQYLLTKVYHYQQPVISALWKSVSDTLNANRRKLKDAQSDLNIQKKTIDSLSAELTGKDHALSRIDNIDILGVVLTKTAYNLIVWGLVILFGITAFVVIARSGSFRREAVYRAQLYTELEEEYKAYKTKANDKEKKLARELQTERNKLDELLGRG